MMMIKNNKSDDFSFDSRRWELFRSSLYRGEIVYLRANRPRSRRRSRVDSGQSRNGFTRSNHLTLHDVGLCRLCRLCQLAASPEPANRIQLDRTRSAASSH